MTLDEKTKDHVLYFCPDNKCQIVTFIGTNKCPVCFSYGLEVRKPIKDKHGR